MESLIEVVLLILAVIGLIAFMMGYLIIGLYYRNSRIHKLKEEGYHGDYN